MNNNLLNIVKRIIAEKGESILADPQKLKALFSDYAKDEPKEERAAFGRCIEIGSYNELKSANSVNERQHRKTVLIDQLNAKGIDRARGRDALDLLETAIFNKTAAPAQGKAPAPVPSALAPSAPVSSTVTSPAPNSQGTFTGYMINNGNSITGPYSLSQLEAMIANGQITLNYTASYNSGNWVRVDKIPELARIFNGTNNPSITVNTIVQNSTVQDRRLRHGFTSFYLWLSFLGSAAGTLFLAVDFVSGTNVFELLFTPSDLWLLRIYSLATSLALLNMINWKKSGFWLFCAAGVVSLFINPEVFFVYYFIFNLISIGIIFGVLHFRNAYNAKSTWEQME